LLTLDKYLWNSFPFSGLSPSPVEEVIKTQSFKASFLSREIAYFAYSFIVTRFAEAISGTCWKFFLRLKSRS
jgi:hypothetical protein